MTNMTMFRYKKSLKDTYGELEYYDLETVYKFVLGYNWVDKETEAKLTFRKTLSRYRLSKQAKGGEKVGTLKYDKFKGCIEFSARYAMYLHRLFTGKGIYDSIPERRLAEKMQEIGVKFQREAKELTYTRYYTPDFYLPELLPDKHVEVKDGDVNRDGNLQKLSHIVNSNPNVIVVYPKDFGVGSKRKDGSKMMFSEWLDRRKVEHYTIDEFIQMLREV